MSVLKDPERLSYANKDLDTIDADVSRYLSEFIPAIKGITVNNEGRMVIRILEALLDMLNYSVDMQFRESNISNVLQEANILKLMRLISYKKAGPAGSQADCTFTMASGVAGVGGQAITLGTNVQKSNAPSENFVTIEAATIPEGDTSITGVAAVQGTAVTAEVLSAAASGDENQFYLLSNSKPIEDQIRVYVGGVLWTKVDNLWDSADGDLHYYVTYDENVGGTVRFGDGDFGSIPGAGAAITCDYIYTDGENHDVGAGEIDTISGALAPVVTVTNPIESTGGSDGDTVADIRKNAPIALRTIWRGVTAQDLIDLALNISGVYSAKPATPFGNSITVYVVPTGGGTASASKLTEIEDYLTERSVIQGDITATAAESARVRIKCHVTAIDNRISKSVLRKWVIDTLTAAFAYDQFDLGDGYTISEVGDIVLQYNDGGVFKSIDFETLSRWPRVEKSNAGAPDMNGDVRFTATAGYNTWQCTATSASAFQVSKDGVIQLVAGAVGVSYTSDGSEVTFTLGETTDTLTPGDIWTFKTSKRSGNLFVEENEHMSLADSDLSVFVYYPGEYDATA